MENELVQRINWLLQEMRSCPAHKRGTSWYADRMVALRNLVATLKLVR